MMPVVPEHTVRHTRICVMANAKSGRGADTTRLDRIMEKMKAQGADAVLRLLHKGEDFTQATREEVERGAQVIVAAGGDGTMSGVARALSGTETPMGILPMGTFNYFARSLGIPEDIEGALDSVIHGRTQRTNIGSFNGEAFLNNASIGIYPQILRTRETTYARWGRSRIAAYWSVIETMMRLPRPLKLKIRADGVEQSVTTPLAFAVSNAFQLREMGLEGAECIEDGKLALLIALNTGRAGLLRHGGALLLGRAERDRNFRLVCAQSLVLESERASMLVARDGERSKMSGPFRIELQAAALTVIAPQHKSDSVR